MSACRWIGRIGIHSDTPVYGGDCHLFRNAGGIVTDDAIRSAALTCNFFGTREIVVLQHTECGMLSKNAADLETHFRDRGVDIDHLQVDPSLPELKLEKGAFAKWLGMFDDVDQTTIRTVEYIRNHPLIPKDVTVSGYVWEVENQRLRKPNPGSNTGREPHFLNARKFRRAPSPADALGVAIGDGRSFPPDLARSEGKRGRKKIRGPFVQRFRNLANFVQVSLR